MSPYATVLVYNHNSHEYVHARQGKHRDVNFEISNYLTAVELLIASEASF